MFQGGGCTLLAAISIATLLAGCVAPAALHPQNGLVPAAEGVRPVVVLVIDSGVNPYHAAFRSAPNQPDASAVASWSAAGPIIRLSANGTHKERAQADERMLRALPLETPYFVEGTRLALAGFWKDPLVPFQDSPGHGTMVTYNVLHTAPHAIVVSAQWRQQLCDPRPDACFSDNGSARALRWGADQPWVDIISMSFGSVGSEPIPKAAFPEIAEFNAAIAYAASKGKVLVSAPTNTPTPNLADFVSGHPQVIAVGGVESAGNTWSAEAALFPDVAANYTNLAPDAFSTDAYAHVWGTSFAAPIVAGTLAEAIHILRSQGVPYDATKLRRALNASAIQWAPTEYDPTKSPSNDTMQIVYSPPAPHLVPGAQMGWGYVDGSLAPEIARRVAENDYAPKADLPTQQAMSAYQAAREAYWARGGLS